MNEGPSEEIEYQVRSADATGRRRSVAMICIALALMVFAVFGQTAGFDFVNLDDLGYIPNHPVVSQGLSLGGIAWAFTHFHGALWHPLTVTTFMLDCRLFGMRAGGYHLVNVLLHAAVAVLLFLLLAEMTGALWRSGFAAAVFAIHPLRAESVVWITERKDVLSGLFFMLTLLAYVRYARGTQSKGGYAMILIWFVMGLMSKSMLVTTPAVLLLLDYWPLGRLRSLADFRALVWEKAPLCILSALSCVATILAIHAGGRHPTAAIPEDAPISYAVYLWKLIYPHNLALPYPIPREGWAPWQIYGAIVLLTGLTAGAYLLHRKQPYLATGWLWYMGMLVPVAGVMQTDYPQPYADRFTYLPQIGLCLAGTWLAADLAKRLRIPKKIVGAIAGITLCVLMAACWQQTSYWRNSITLWTHTIKCTQDNYYAHYVLGNALLLEGHNEQSIGEFRESLRIDPAHKETHLDLGTALLRENRTGEAVAEFREAVKIDPTDAGLHSYLGTALLRLGNIDDANQQFHEAICIDPSFSHGLNEVGNAMLRQGRVAEAIAEYRGALRMDPNNAVAQTNLGNALFQQGMSGEAVTHLEKAIDLQPANGTIQNYLAWLLATAAQASLRDGPRALDLAIRASQAPGGRNPYFLRTLAAAYAENGKFPDALQAAQAALQLAVTESDAAFAAAIRKDITLYQTGHRLADAD